MKSPVQQAYGIAYEKAYIHKYCHYIDIVRRKDDLNTDV